MTKNINFCWWCIYYCSFLFIRSFRCVSESDLIKSDIGAEWYCWWLLTSLKLAWLCVSIPRPFQNFKCIWCWNGWNWSTAFVNCNYNRGERLYQKRRYRSIHFSLRIWRGLLGTVIHIYRLSNHGLHCSGNDFIRETSSGFCDNLKDRKDSPRLCQREPASCREV